MLTAMSLGLRQALLIGLGGFFCGALILALARRQLITLRYTIAWLSIAAIGVLGAFLTRLVAPIADGFGMSPTGVLLASSTLVLLAITLQLSISVSGLRADLQTLAESHALLAERLERVVPQQGSE